MIINSVLFFLIRKPHEALIAVFIETVDDCVNCFQKVMGRYCNVFTDVLKSCLWHVPTIKKRITNN